MIDFVLDITPPETTAQQKGIDFKRKRVFTKESIKEIERMYCLALAPHRPKVPLMGPVKLAVTFTFPWRESEPLKNRALGWVPKPTKPDGDNTFKNFGDAMGTVGFFAKGDEQICHLTIIKGWGNTPSIRVKIEEWKP